jgi:hypothetical protein
MKDEILAATNRGLEVFKSYLFPNFTEVGKAFKNPYYDDNKASCYIFLDKVSNTYKFKDFGDPEYSGDCFQFVAKINGFNCSDKNDFNKILNLINDRLILNIQGFKAVPNFNKPIQKVVKSEIPEEVNIEADEITIPIEHKNFDSTELEFWNQYGISQDTLKFFNVVSIKKFSGKNKNGISYELNSSRIEPIFGYIQKRFVKLYQPFSKIRFLYAGETNPNYVFGLEQLPSRGDILFITGGEKDVLSLYSNGFNAICFNSETVNISKSIIKRLRARFKHIVLLYDTDKTGIECMKKHTSSLAEYNILSLTLPLPGTKESKDISDYFRLGNTKEQLMNLFCKLLDSIYEETMSILKSCEIDFMNPPIKAEPIISINEVTVGSAGNLLCITGMEGSGKSNYLGGILSGAICRPGTDIDTLGTTIQNNINDKAVIVYDTEQSEDQLYKNMSHLLKRSNLNYPPNYFKAYCLVGMSRKERLQSILQSMDKFYYEFNGIHMVVIDGIADLISGVNDEEQSVELVDELFRLAGIYKTCIICVLHLSPSGMKLRGHLGSEIQRKAAGIISIEKSDNSNTSVVKALKVRDGSPLEVPMIQFGWDEELKRHVSLGIKSKEDTDHRKIEELSGLVKDLFARKNMYTTAELTLEIMNYLNIKERMARNYLKFMKDYQIITVNPQNSQEITTNLIPF